MALAVLFLFVTSAGAVQTTVRHEQVKIDGQRYEAAHWMDEYADQQEWEYRDNYVLSKWGRNRMYNYFVNGEARGYEFAERNYEPFLGAKDPEQQYRKLRDDVGFVVTKDLNLNGPVPEDTMYSRLHHRFGSASMDGTDGVSHYRAIYASDDGSVKVFTLVPGANVTGTAPAGETLSVETSVEIEGAEFDYRQNVEIGEDGNFTVTVPYPGTYSVGNQTVEVSENAVQSGGNVSVGG